MKDKLFRFFANMLLLNTISLRGGDNNIKGRFAALRCRVRICIKGKGNRISIAGGRLYRCKIYVQGSGNTITIGENCSIQRSVIWISGDNNSIDLGERIHIFNADLGAEQNGSILRLRDGARVGGFVALGFGSNRTLLSRVYASEGRCVDIGEECAVSDGVTIRTGDSHTIRDGNGERINPAKDVKLGKNVWICSGSTLLKGAGIGEGSILGGGSVLTKDYYDKKQLLLAGSPAKPMRENISWDFNI